MKYSFLWLLLCWQGLAFAQSGMDTIQYTKDTFNVQQDTLISFEIGDTPIDDTELLLAIWLDQDTVLEIAPIQKTGNDVTGSFPCLFLDQSISLELALGTAMVRQMVETGDSVVHLQSEALAMNETRGNFYLDFRNGAGKWEDLMLLSNYNYWLQQINNLRDSLKITKQDSIRASQMIADFETQVKTNKKTVANTAEKLASYSAYQADFDKIRKASKKVNTGLKKVKNGQQLTQEEMMAIADATGERQKTTIALKKKDAEACQVFQNNQSATERLSHNQQQLTVVKQLQTQTTKKRQQFRQQLYTATQKFDYFEGLYKK